MYFGLNLQYLRKLNGNMSQEKLAERLGVSRDTLKNWLRGDAEIPASKVAEMARLFQCSSDYLLGLR